jgi:Domain of Unknown Function (DUF748)
MEPSTHSGGTPRRSLAAGIGLGIAAAIAAMMVMVFIASFFLDGIIRPRLEAKMNSNLKGYHATLGHAHVQLLTLRLTLRNLVIVQEAHPAPPVADFPLTRFRIHWKELLSARVVANVGLWNPTIHIDEAQLITERRSKTPLRQRGWQDALQSVYPFKINRLAITNGDITYVDKPGAKPLHLTRLRFVSDNIRNIHEPDYIYPSRFHAQTVVFDSGRLELDGRANFLMKPFPGMVTHYVLTEAPLGAVSPASRHVNLIIRGGTLSSAGVLEYSPKVTNVDVQDAAIDGVNLTYVSLPQTQRAEKERVNAAGKAIQKENNRSAVNIRLRQMAVRNSRLAFENKASDPPYELYITGTNLTVTNLGNHAEQGLSRVNLTGEFMGSGATRVYGTFVATGSGPQFTNNVEILNTDLTGLNPLLRAYGRFDVAQGSCTVYAQMNVKNSRITGYVKPMFSNVKVYDPQKDKNKGVLQQAKEMVVGAAAHVFKNRSTQKVATQVTLNGDLKNPNISTWQAFVEVVRNAFVQAILPGFDRQIEPLSARAARPQNG